MFAMNSVQLYNHLGETFCSPECSLCRAHYIYYYYSFDSYLACFSEHSTLLFHFFSDSEIREFQCDIKTGNFNSNHNNTWIN